MAKRLATEDLDHIVFCAREAFRILENARLFMTGGIGFFGMWMVESLLHANRELGLNIQITVLTRLPQKFQNKALHLAGDPAVHLLGGDVRSFDFPAGTFTHIIHAATDSTAPGNRLSEKDLAESIIDGTRRVLQLMQTCGAKRFL